jgi:hypothetical protein
MLTNVPRTFRARHNILSRSAKDGKTPAKHLGLVAGVIRIDHILGFDAQGLMKRAMRAAEVRDVAWQAFEKCVSGMRQ